MSLQGKPETFQQKAIRLITNYVEEHFDKSDPQAPYYEVYVVWFSKTLQNWKALLSTTLPDQMYYEVTYNGDLGETYIDAYKKIENMKVPD
ncbi:MAG: hypothetical protein HMLIMOIP_002080 [Candidatus Nitrosomirales archaeon]|jgi:hypothetical protein